MISFEHAPTETASLNVNGVIPVMALEDLNFGLGGGSGIGGRVPMVANGTRSTAVIRIERSTEFIPLEQGGTSLSLHRV